jgi:two-component system, response regulator YesN
VYKVLIAEDELIERETLAAILKEEFSDFLTVEYIAPNGLFALKYLFSHQVDILFLDIRMPVMDGVEIMRELERANRQVEIVVVSAFSDFSYARKAISCGAVDYLLKPYTRANLRSAVIKAVEKLKRKEVVELDREALRKQRGRLRNIINRDVISSIFYLNSPPSENEFDQLISILDLPSSTWRLIVLKFSEAEDPLDELEWEQLLDFYRSRRRYSIVYGSGWELIALEFFPSDQQDPRFEFFPDHCCRFCRNELARDVEFSISPAHIGSGPLSAAYAQSLADLANIHDSASRGKTGRAADLARSISIALVSMETNEITAVEKKVQHFFEGTAPEQRTDSLRSTVTLVQGELYHRLPQKTAADIDARLNSLKVQIIRGDSSELHSLLLMLRTIFSDLKSRLGNTPELMCKRVESFILDHLAEDLSIQRLARSEGISLSHLSRLFKETTGFTLNQRIVDLRVQRGEELLKGEGLNVKEAAFRVGIRDPNYFSKLYRKRFGRAPTQKVNKTE